MIYSLLKLLHVTAVIIFLGNIITCRFWLYIAMKTKDIKIIRYSVHGVILSDKVFTIPAVICIIVGGILAAFYASISVIHTGWILWPIILFALSGVIFSLKLSPLQKRMLEAARGEESEKTSASINNSYREWKKWATIAITLPLTALAMMVLKIPG